ncbi:MAG: DUF790 family protein [Myxococcota bacterium]
MLPVHLLLVTSHENHPGRAAPRYLTPRDEVWVQKVAIACDAFVGRTVGERDAELPALARAIAREHGAAKRVADGVAHVLVRRFTTEVDAVAKPGHVRRVTFEEAAREEIFNRGLALASAAQRLSLTVDAVEHALFADRPSRRKIVADKTPLNAGELVEAYNLALVQGLLVRSEQVRVEVREHVRAVVRFAKLASLLCTYSVCQNGTRLDVSGPLSILRHTTKYGFALASFFPAVVATAGFRLEARCVLGGEPMLVRIDACDRIARTHKLPRDADSAVERALARDIRRLGTPWTLVRESDAISIGGRSFFPDFTLRHPDGFLALVEVVGFYTPEYLRSKLGALRGAATRPLIVCIDESLACDDGEIPGAILRFKRRIDAATLIAAAEHERAVLRTAHNQS